MFFSEATPTSDSPSVTIVLPPATKITQTFPTDTQPRHVTRLHPAGTAFVPPHWHATHTEHLRVVQGWVLITVGNDTRLYGPDSGTANIPPYTIHCFAHGDHPMAKPYWAGADLKPEPGWASDDVIMEEWTTPWEGQKELFFRNGMSFYHDNVQPALEGRWSLMLVPALPVRFIWMLQFSARLDNYPLIVGLTLGRGGDGKANRFARVVTGGVMALAMGIGRLCGWTAWREEYTPLKLQATAKAM